MVNCKASTNTQWSAILGYQFSDPSSLEYWVLYKPLNTEANPGGTCY